MYYKRGIDWRKISKKNKRNKIYIKKLKLNRIQYENDKIQRNWYEMKEFDEKISI